ncbi:solute symporter family protein [Pseudactinotalea sp. Z1748]|uniref:solute symporter family protein n=1 Tax=Pseudactinotalea sp. Z1748 TaxID=3413027 RepID=UPI003C7E0497
MSLTAVVTLTAVVVVVLGVSVATRPRNSSTVDFYLAGQRVGVVTNSWAICGDYLSAASFLGVAAAVYASGLDGAWYAVGFAAGFVPVLLFVAAPLRRFGEFSLADFLGRRLQSHRVRLSAVGVVQLVILCYLIPQSLGSGITWELLVGHGILGLSPYVTGVLLSTAVIAVVVAFGGMRGTTWNQAVQFLLLFAALLWLAVTVSVDGFHYGNADPLNFSHAAGAGVADSEVGLRGGRVGQVALVVTLAMGTAGLPHVMNRYFTSPTGRAARTTTLWVLVLVGAFYAMAVLLGTAARDIIPSAATEHAWLADLTVEGVLRVPEHALPVLGRLYGGQSGLGFVAAAALIAAMSTVAGLLLASAATWGHDVYERYINPRATQKQAVRAGRLTTLLGAGLAAGLAIALRTDGFAPSSPSLVATMVTWAFAIAGSALTPVVVLSIWWRGITAAAATAGMVTGGGLAVTMVLSAEFMDPSALRDLMSAPTLVAAPVAIAVTVLVSLRTPRPEGTDAAWLTMHGTAADRQAERLASMMVGRGRERMGVRGRVGRRHRGGES